MSTTCDVLLNNSEVKTWMATKVKPNQIKPVGRKIENQMIEAIKNNQDWHSANTVVEYINGISTVKLHGHVIAKVGDRFIQLFDGGHQTNTTKSRLNAILKGCGLPGECVFAKQFEWFINIKFHEITTVPFFSGMRIN
jgi:hypothetical protein